MSRFAVLLVVSAALLAVGQKPSSSAEQPAGPPKPLFTFGDTRFRHTDAITGIAFHPNGKTLAAAANGEPFVRVWDVATGKEVKRYDLDVKLGPTDNGYRAVRGYSADGTRLIHTGRKNELVLRDTATGKPVASLDSESYTLALSPDATRMAFRTPGGRVVIHDTGTGKLVRDFGVVPTPPPEKLGNQIPVRVAFSPDGKRVIVTNYEKGFYVGSVDGAEPLTHHPSDHEWVGRLWWPSAERVVMVGSLKVYEFVSFDTATWKAVARREYKPSGLKWVGDVPLSGKLVGLRESDGRHVLVDPVTFDPAGGVELPTPPAYAGGYHVGPGNLVAGWHGTAIQVFDRKTGKSTVPELDRVPVSGGGRVYPSADGKRLLVTNASSSNHSLHVWDTTTGDLLTAMNADPTLYIQGLAFDPGGRWVAATVGHTAYGFIVWDAATGKEVVRQTVPPPKEREAVWSVRVVGFVADGLWVMETKTGEFRLLELPSGKVLRTADGFPETVHTALSSDGKRVAVSGRRVVAVRSFDADAKWEVVVKYTDDGRSWGSGGYNGPLMPQVGFTRAGELTRYYGPTGLYNSIAVRVYPPSDIDPRGATPMSSGNPTMYSPDARYLYRYPEYTEVNTPVVEVVETCTGRPVGRIPLPSRAGFATSWDGTRLYTSNGDTTISVWDLPALAAKYLPTEGVTDPWAALASPDAAVGHAAVRQAAADPKAVGWLREQFAKPHESPLAGLIADLGNKEYKTREAATKALGELGEAARADLRRVVTERPSEEAAERATRLLAVKPQREWAGLPLDRVREVRAVEVLERIGTPDAVKLLGEWAKADAPVRKAEAAAALTRLPRLPRKK